MFSNAVCPTTCHACRHKHLSEAESLTQKQLFVQTKLLSVTQNIEPIRHTTTEQRTAYRKKVCLHTQYNAQAWEAGTLRRLEFTPIMQCPLHHPSVNAAMNLLLEALPLPDSFPLRFYVQTDRQVMLVLKTAKMPSLNWLTETLTSSLAHIGTEGLWIHLNPSAGHKIFMKHPYHLIYGQASSQDENGLMYGPLSFQQLIPELYANAGHEALAFLNPVQGDLVTDLYCGTGSTMKLWLGTGATVSGVELFGEAVTYASINAPGASVFRGTCTQRLPQLTALAETHSGGTKLLYANPPRTGLEKEVTDWIINTYKAKRIAYMSCSPGTLGRDLLKLKEGGYHVLRVIPYDFFPNTHHVECLALLVRGIL